MPKFWSAMLLHPATARCGVIGCERVGESEGVDMVRERVLIECINRVCQ